MRPTSKSGASVCPDGILAVVVAAAIGAGVLAGCGSAATHRGVAQLTTAPRDHVDVLKCPSKRVIAADKRSKGLNGKVIAPAGTLRTIVCTATSEHELKYRGGPFDTALNTAYRSSGGACGTSYVTPLVLLLDYKNSALDRQIVVDTGCPSIVLSPSKSLTLTTRAVSRINHLVGERS
jgi:hypothetical protein